MPNLIFDIETAPLSREDVDAAFDPRKVKYGNTIDEAKREKKRQADLEAWRESAALHPVSGQVVAIGWDDGENHNEWLVGVDVPDEVGLLDYWWNLARHYIDRGYRLVGFNSEEFDLPFLRIRSLKLGVHVPPEIWTWERGRFYWRSHVDLMKAWQCGCGYRSGCPVWTMHQAGGAGLEALCKWLDIGEKLGCGQDFDEWLQTDPGRARAYLARDIELTKALAERIGLTGV